jgi:hypothetical protein
MAVSKRGRAVDGAHPAKRRNACQRVGSRARSGRGIAPGHGAQLAGAPAIPSLICRANLFTVPMITSKLNPAVCFRTRGATVALRGSVVVSRLINSIDLYQPCW